MKEDTIIIIQDCSYDPGKSRYLGPFWERLICVCPNQQINEMLKFFLTWKYFRFIISTKPNLKKKKQQKAASEPHLLFRMLGTHGRSPTVFFTRPQETRITHCFLVFPLPLFSSSWLPPELSLCDCFSAVLALHIFISGGRIMSIALIYGYAVTVVLWPVKIQ